MEKPHEVARDLRRVIALPVYTIALLLTLLRGIACLLRHGGAPWKPERGVDGRVRIRCLECGHRY